MLYKLNEQYALRGWDKTAWVLVDWNSGMNRFLTAEDFQTLVLCDGQTELGTNLLSGKMQAALEKFVQEGIVIACAEPDSIQGEQYYRYYKNRFVRSVFWSITGRCNYKCRHCYMDAPDALYGELSTEESLRLIDEFAACGVQSVDITGGEPFVRKDFWQLIDRMLSYHIRIGTIYTNGWLLDETMLAEFEKRNMRPRFAFSYDGVGWHDWMRRVDGAEAAAERAMMLCREHGFKTLAQVCLHSGNRHTLAQTVERLAELGVSSVKVDYVTETELWKQNSEGRQYSERDFFEAAIAYIPEFYKKGCPVNLTLCGVISMYKDSAEKMIIPERYSGCTDCLDQHLCGAVRWNVYVTPEGRLLPCMPMTSSPTQDQFPLISEIGLAKGLSDSYFMQFVDSRVKDLLERNSECAACEYKYSCGGGCRAAALIEYDKDIWGADRGQCILWKEGYVERIRAAAEKAVREYAK